jgi:hypothetical protein
MAIERGDGAARIAELLKPERDDYFVLKPKHSGFHATPLDLLLRHLQARRLVIAGVSGDQCVLYTVADARMHDYEVVVPRDCVASLTECATAACSTTSPRCRKSRRRSAARSTCRRVGNRDAPGRPLGLRPAADRGPCHDRSLTRRFRVDQALSFLNPYSHGFARVSVAVPRMRVADPVFNAAESVALLAQAAEQGAVLVAFPELGLSAYTCDDLFHQRALLDGCEAALGTIAEATATSPVVAIVGLPLRVDHRLFNCAAVVAGGRVLGIVPKTYLPNYGEFYEARQFNAGDSALAPRCGCSAPTCRSVPT